MSQVRSVIMAAVVVEAVGVAEAPPAHNKPPCWASLGSSTQPSSYENLKGVPAPPLRSDSYAAFRNHERPNSSVES